MWNQKFSSWAFQRCKFGFSTHRYGGERSSWSYQPNLCPNMAETSEYLTSSTSTSTWSTVMLNWWPQVEAKSITMWRCGFQWLNSLETHHFGEKWLIFVGASGFTSLGEKWSRKTHFWHQQLVLYHIDELRNQTYTIGKPKRRPFDPTKKIFVTLLSLLITEAFSDAPNLTSPLGISQVCILIRKKYNFNN